MDFATAGTETDHPLHLSPHAQFGHQQSSGTVAYTQFRHPAGPTIDGGLESTNNGRPTLTVHPSASPHLMHDSPALPPQHLSHTIYGDMSRSSMTPSTPSNSASPRFSGLSPGQSKQFLANFTPQDRSLPSRDVTEDTIDEAYAQFILYCNPSFPLSTDTSELIKAFQVPPKSDGKSFSSYRLYELISKFEQKEIKTWTQLALDLGVEPPSIEKGQSTQKVQQYSVRLKRWMRAMHIDAFYEYLMGKQHGYYMQVPPPNNPFPEAGRDGVPLEEDLAVRALDPKFRPKRGRRKADDGDEEMDELPTPPPKRPHVDTALAFATTNNFDQPQSAYPSSAIPMSAHPDAMDRYVDHDPWTANSTLSSAITSASVNPQSRLLTPQSTTSAASAPTLRWRLNTQDNPTTPHPLSATPVTAHPDSAFDEPQSAVTPSSKTRARRRHGPAVSSAWPSNSNNPSGKLRGRPPSNRSVRDGPFVTFPANPKTKEGPTIDLNRNTPAPTPVVETPATAQSDPGHHSFRFPPTPASAISMSSQQSSLSSGRPERLSLQVPQHIGGPVHLVTPTVLVNGETETPTATSLGPSALSAQSQRGSPHFFDGTDNGDSNSGFARPANPQRSSHSPSQSLSKLHNASPNTGSGGTSSPTITYEALKRSLAADLLRGDITGRKRLRGAEAKTLAEAILNRVCAQSSSSASAASAAQLGGRRQGAARSADQVQLLAIATLLGLAGAVGPGFASSAVTSMKKIAVRRFRVGGDGYDSPVDDDEDAEGEADGEDDPTDQRVIRESVDVEWSVMVGGLTATCAIKGVVAEEEEEEREPDTGLESGIADDNPEWWKRRWEEANEKLKKKEEEVRQLKEKVLEVML